MNALGFLVLAWGLTSMLQGFIIATEPGALGRHSPSEVLLGLQFRILLAGYAPLFRVCGLFGAVTTIGLVRLRPWGWWCGILWTVIYAVYYILLATLMPARMPTWAPVPYNGIGPGLDGWEQGILSTVVCIHNNMLVAMVAPAWMPMWSIAACVAMIALLVWPLATRRQLFFPPKPGGEE